MPDSIRMMDLAILSRPTDQARAVDPEHRAMADRQAFRAAIKHVEQAHQDILQSDGAEELQLDEHSFEDRNHRRKARVPEKAKKVASAAPSTAPEIDEGHLLDIKA